MFKKMSLKAKLIGICMSLAVCLLIVAATGFLSLRTVSEKYKHVAEINLGNSITLGNMQAAASEMSAAYLNLAIHGISEADVKKWKEDYANSVVLYENNDKKYNEIEFVEGEQAFYDAQNKEYKNFLAESQELVALAGSKNPADVEKYAQLLPKVNAAEALHSELLNKLIQFQVGESQKWSAKANEAANLGNFLCITISAVALLLSIVVSVLFSSSLSKTLGEIGKQISNTGEQVGVGSVQLSGSSQQVSSGATEAASALQQTVASVEELSSMVKLNADAAKQAASLSNDSTRSAETGETEIQNLIQSMTDISQSSKKIEEIINVIDDIAFQTNLLALNAAVEAARAGEQGKGFAVVAEAVRNLAQRSAAAAKDITVLIKESVTKIEGGSKIADTSGSVLKNIVSSIKKVSELNNQIASASNEQANGISQISKAMAELDTSVQQNAAASEEVAAAAEEMSSQAEILQGMSVELDKVIQGDRGQVASTKKETRLAEQGPSAKFEFQSKKSKPNHVGKAKKENYSKILPITEDEQFNASKSA